MILDDPEELPAAPGAYALLIAVSREISLPGKGGGMVVLAEGVYLYAGSANGPGGIRARARRHLKGAKAVRWHVDRLTNVFGVAAMLAVPGGRECRLIEWARDKGAMVNAPGFGSSDCRTCPAHLVRLGGEGEVDGWLERLAGDCPGAAAWRAPPVMCYWTPPS